MKDYTNNNPVFKKAIKVLDTSDTNHADNVNVATEQLLQNTLVNEENIGLHGKFQNGVYDGRDLTEVFAEEIENYSDVWAWIKARTTAVNFSGLMIGDYIPLNANGNTVIAEIAGIDTYFDAYNGAVGHHIDFISRDCYPFTSGQAPIWASGSNNGNSEESCPYMVSNIKSWLNTTLYGYLPAALKNVISDKMNYLETRYSSSGALTDSTGKSWKNMGKLWIPTEYEVYGTCVYGTRIHSEGFNVWYPIFQDGLRHRIKHNGNGGSRCCWWLASADSGYSYSACYVSNYGNAYYDYVDNPYCGVPLCFRISA